MNKMYELIEELCKSKETNITQMCKLTGIPRSVFSELKSGRTKQLSNKYLPLVAKFFNVSIDYLLGNEQKEKPATDEGDEPLEDCIVLHRDGKTQRYKFTQKQLDLMAEMIEQLGGEKVDL